MNQVRWSALGVGLVVATLLGVFLYVHLAAPDRETGVPDKRAPAIGIAVVAAEIRGLEITREQIGALEARFAEEPENANVVRNLAVGYARALVSDADTASASRAALDSSSNVWILGNATYWLQSEYNRNLQLGFADVRLREFAERYFARALRLDPTLDREQILPQIDLEEIAARQEAERVAAEAREVRRKKAVGEIRRLDPDEIPGLPAGIVATLTARGCRIPQAPVSSFYPDLSNALRGEFYAPGRESWAVYCSDGTASDLLVFEDASGDDPDVISTREDLFYIDLGSNDEALYLRRLSAVDRDWITEHWEFYAQVVPGAEPPVDLEAIDHEAVNDAYLEKASDAWYFADGKWIELPGAD